MADFYIGVVVALLSMPLGAAEGGRLMRRHPGLTVDTALAKAPHFYPIAILSGVAVAAISVPGVHSALAWRGPLWLELHLSTILYGGLAATAGFLFGAGSWIAQKTAHQARRTLPVAGLLVIVGIQISYWQNMQPLASELTDIVNRHGIVLQSSGVTCAAASGANIARRFGIAATEREMARRMGTTERGGTSAAQIIIGMEQVGIHCEKMDVPSLDPAVIPAPAMMFVDVFGLPPEGHAVALMGMKDGQAEVWDPLRGKVLYTAEKLKKIWHGKAMPCRK